MVGLFLVAVITVTIAVEPCDDASTSSEAVSTRPLPPKPVPITEPDVGRLRLPPQEDRDHHIIPRPAIPASRETPRFYPLRRIFRSGVEAICGMLGAVGLFPKAIVFIEGVFLLGMIALVTCLVFGLIYLLKRRE